MRKPKKISIPLQKALDNRSKTVEEVLETLRQGTELWKIRSLDKWFRRKYYLDEKKGTICYEPTRKSPCRSPNPEIEVEDILDVRKGWKTDTFNKIARQVEKKLTKHPDSKPAVDEASCFSIVHGRSKHSVDLVAPDPTVADHWVRGINHLITVLRSLHQEQRFERWLKQQFDDADTDKNGILTFEECLKLLNQLNIKIPKSLVRRMFQEANTNKNQRNGQDVLDSEEFVEFCMNLMSRPEIKQIFQWYAKSSGEMEVEELHQFLVKEQRCLKFSKEACLTLIEAFEQSPTKDSGSISPMGFTNLLLSEQFEIFSSEHRVVYQDMTQPLAHYFIASSHNTYLTGGQLSGESSVEGYIDALKRGCRCVELDLWDGADGEPIVYHGYTLTTKILFKDILVDAIKPYSFYSSEYPVILSLENHCSEAQQEVVARYFVEVLGELLYTDEVSENVVSLPSPHDLKGKIIIKAKKLKPGQRSDDSSSEEEDSESEAEPVSKQAPGELAKEGKVVAEGLANLVNICEAKHFHDFETSRLKGKYYHMSSFSEAKANKLVASCGAEFVEYNTRQLSRIYPSAKRTGSSNFKPTGFWNAGCQLVALNYQSSKKPMFLNEAKFRQNGGCGYVLKPELLRDPTLHFDPNAFPDKLYQRTLILEIISGQHIPKPEQGSDSDIVDPYVKVKIIGHREDNQTLKTHVVKDNGFNPRWDFEMRFDVKLPELAMVHFIVKDDSKDVTLGTYALPFDSLALGYRHVFLMDYTRDFVSPASLFVHVTVE
ncbi:1-phosphatidylinositol 4,5-bisphosphate phosphodiesterase eta-2-like isoform X2 [Bacillus rossius redtenbacheri]|uniref:1-phosphatidylinositol 4,5-bisphosphate phosphodiesterase eta-2-like isoform X2 n=1 Tax=Bacillus rossius redtenbacheri TaxID=93214 RepID=UPI002FDE3F71